MTEQEPIPTGPLPEEEQRRLVDKIIEAGERIIQGKGYSDVDRFPDSLKTPGQTPLDVPKGEFDIKESEGEEDKDIFFDGVIVDLNDPRFNPDNQKKLLDWMETQLEAPLTEASIKAEYVFADQSTRFKVFDKPFGIPDDPYQFSEWQNEGEKPSYIFWTEGMYEYQEESGFTRINE